jgi:hypothetical protein
MLHPLWISFSSGLRLRYSLPGPCAVMAVTHCRAGMNAGHLGEADSASSEDVTLGSR